MKFQESLSSKRILTTVFITGITVLLLMTAYEVIKQLLWPKIGILESHIVTIIFTTFAATIISYFLAKKNEQLVTNLEERVHEQTADLVKANDLLQKEVAEHRFAEERLQQNQYYLEKAQELGHIGTWELDLVQNRLVWTDENCRIFGVPLGSVVNYDIFLDRVHPDDREYVDREWQAALKGKPYDIEHRILVDDQARWVREKADVDFDKEGNAVKAIGFTQDMTERKEVESGLRESEDKFRSLVDNIPGITYRCALDEHWTMHYMSDQIEQISGYPASDFIGNAVRTYESVIHREDTGYVDKSVREGVDAGRAWEIEYRICHKDGGIRWVYEKGRGIAGRDGGVDFLDGFILDITERKQVAERLHQNQILVDMTSRMAKVGGWEFDVESKRLTWTDETYRIHEKAQSEEYVNLEEAFNFFHPDDQPILKKAFEEAVNQGKPYDLELRFTTAKGRNLWTHTICEPEIVNGKVVKLHGSFQDSTERKHIEQRLQQNANELNWLFKSMINAFVLFDSVFDEDGRFIELLSNVVFRPKSTASFHRRTICKPPELFF